MKLSVSFYKVIVSLFVCMCGIKIFLLLFFTLNAFKSRGYFQDRISKFGEDIKSKIFIDNIFRLDLQSQSILD